MVHGNDGLDEITIADSTRVWELRDGDVREYNILPEGSGVTRAPLSEIQAFDAEQSASMLRDVLAGRTGAARDVVLLNAAAALLAANMVLSIPTGVDIAADAIDTGSAMRRMEAFVALSQELE